MKLFEPGRIGTMEVKNRIVMAPMGVGRMAEADGDWGVRVREYYILRARGGTGLITTSLVFVSQQLEFIAKHDLNLYLDSHLESLHKIVEGVHQYGAKISVQLTAGFGRVVGTPWRKPGAIPISASPTRCYFTPKVIARPISTQETEELAQAFGAAAKRCATAGVDAIELHGHEGYLLDQFMSELWNQRNDKYGGSREKRLTFAREAIAAIKREVGKDFPVIYRFGIDHYLKGGRKLEESLWIAEQLEAMGIDALHVDAGCYETSWWPHPPTYQPAGCMVDMAEKVKPVVKVPIITVGKLHYATLAEKVLQEGRADFVAIGRGLLADPDWPNKVIEGRLDDIRPCLGDHDGCLAELRSGRATSCTVNPACGHEKQWALTPVRDRKKLLIVGGGPAGMEAARVAALRGLEVTLWEKTPRLGGNLWPASVPEFKKDLGDFMNYQVTQLKKLPVKIEFDKEATVDDIVNFGADSVILATGSRYAVPRITGGEKKNVTTAADLLLGKKRAKEPVVIIGGGLTGCETALWLAQQGKKDVTIVEMLDELMRAGFPVFHANRTMLINLLKFHNVRLLTGTTLLEITDRGVGLIDKKFRRSYIDAGIIVLATGLECDQKLFGLLRDKVPHTYLIGDAKEPRNIMHAIWDAFHTARKID